MGGKPPGLVERLPTADFRGRLEALLPPGFGPFVRKALEQLRRDVSRFPDQLHHFVIAEQDLHPATGCGCLGLERDQEIQNGADFCSPSEEVAGLDEDGGAADPAPLIVDEARPLQNPRKRVGSAVNIANRDDT